MTEYITVEDVDTALGIGWTTEDKKARSVMLANVWLTSKRLPVRDPIPDEWKSAGAEIAKEAANGKIFGAVEKGVLSKAVKADNVSSTKTFSTDHKIVSAGESLALALLDPWLRNSGVFMLKRI